MSNSLKEQYASSPLYGSNAAAVEAMYEQYVANPDSVPEGWRRYFRSLGGDGTEVLHSPIRRRLIDTAMLAPWERAWIDDYHRLVLEKIGPRVDGDDLDWLKAATAPL